MNMCGLLMLFFSTFEVSNVNFHSAAFHRWPQKFDISHFVAHMQEEFSKSGRCQCSYIKENFR